MDAMHSQSSSVNASHSIFQFSGRPKLLVKLPNSKRGTSLVLPIPEQNIGADLAPLHLVHPPAAAHQIQSHRCLGLLSTSTVEKTTLMGP